MISFQTQSMIYAPISRVVKPAKSVYDGKLFALVADESIDCIAFPVNDMSHFLRPDEIHMI